MEFLIFKHSDSDTVGMLYVTGDDGRAVTKIQTNIDFMICFNLKIPGYLFFIIRGFLVNDC